jgi:hypothetical protein
VVSYWSAEEIARAAKNFDVIVVDYIQAMVNAFGDSDQERTALDKIISTLARIVASQNKIVLCVSSIAKSKYDSQSIDVYKGTANLEYSAQSGMILKKVGPQRSMLVMNKNTRGPQVVVYLATDLGHCKFEEVTPNQFDIPV